MALQYLLVLITLTGVHCILPYRICVPVQHLKACQNMLEVETKSKTTLECLPARDRVDCLYQIQQRKADLVPLDPEDMYLATNIPKQDFMVFQEYRKSDELNEEFGFQAVAVVDKDLPIDNLNQLKGLKSCHSGVYKFAGYKMPLAVLSQLSTFPKMNSSISPFENELRALSLFFNSSCVAGKWTNPQRNSVWKSKYSQLCALCENPDDCDFPDEFSGNDGALRCLTHNRGQIAFTKLSHVRKFFELSTDTTLVNQTANSFNPEYPDKYVYLCTDGSKIPIREKACSWGAKPWQGLLGHKDMLAVLKPLREKIKQLAEAGAATKPKPDWFTKVLRLSKKIRHVVDIVPIPPATYLKRANFTQIIEREHGPPEPTVRLCVTSDVALAKCRTMAAVAYSHLTRMPLDCIPEPTESDCLRSVQNNGSDLAIVDGLAVAQAAKEYNLHPVFHEVFGDERQTLLGFHFWVEDYAVAVVKKDSSYTSLEDLRGKRSCHSPYGSFSGLVAPLYGFIKKGLIAPDDCLRKVTTFFSGGSCLPGVEKLEHNPKGDYIVSLLKKQCTADYSPLTCLEEDYGDVAFVSSSDLKILNSSEYELLCLNRKEGGRSRLEYYNTCNIAKIPPRTWVSTKDVVLDTNMAFTPFLLTKLMKESPDLFNMYGEYLGKSNVIFTNTTTGIEFSTKKALEDYITTYDTISNCSDIMKHFMLKKK